MVSAIPREKLIFVIKILHQSGRGVWYTEEVMKLLVEENLVEGWPSHAACTQETLEIRRNGDKKKR